MLEIPASASPHVSEQVAVAAQVTTQSASHLMSHEAVSSQEIMLFGPRLILHTASSLHTAVELAPAFRSQFAIMSQVIWLPSPPFPLHSDVSWHSSVSAPFDIPLHFDPVVHSSEQALAPQSVL